jgi:hypothetical protein
VSKASAAKGAIKDLAFGIYHDEELANLMEAVVAAKDGAVEGDIWTVPSFDLTLFSFLEENFTVAKALKTLYLLSKRVFIHLFF